MKSLDKLYKYFNYLKKAGIALSGVAVIGMILFITADVLSRNILSSSIPGSYEFVENYFMPLATFPALVFAYTEGIMPRMNMIVLKFPKIVQKVMIYIILGVDFLIMALLTYYTFSFSITSMLEGASFPSAGNLYPIYPFIFLAPIGFFFVLMEVSFVLMKNIKSKEVYVTYTKTETSEIDLTAIS